MTIYRRNLYVSTLSNRIVYSQTNLLNCSDTLMTESALSSKDLLSTLEQATITCADCGDKYGVHSVRYSSWWNGKCHICGEEKPVTEARDFAYFFTTRKQLQRKLAEEA